MRLSRRKTGTDGKVRMGEGRKLTQRACRGLELFEIAALRSIAQGSVILSLLFCLRQHTLLKQYAGASCRSTEQCAGAVYWSSILEQYARAVR